MARGRMLNRKVAISGKVAEYGKRHGPWAVVFQHRLIAFLDKNGNSRADDVWLKAEIMPRVDEVTPAVCRQFLQGLVDVGLAVPYEAEGMEYVHVPGFVGEQVGLRRDKEKRHVPVPHGFDEEAGVWPEAFRNGSGRLPEGIRRIAG